MNLIKQIFPVFVFILVSYWAAADELLSNSLTESRYKLFFYSKYVIKDLLNNYK
jgi:hypothetical protein